MVAAIIVLLSLGVAAGAYLRAREEGTWSNKQFLAVLLLGLGVAAVGSLPLALAPWSTVDAHQGLFVTLQLATILAGVIVITIYANRWRRRTLAQRKAASQPAQRPPEDSSGT
jgi:H+/Cl- antiporter ClcA